MYYVGLTKPLFKRKIPLLFTKYSQKTSQILWKEFRSIPLTLDNIQTFGVLIFSCIKFRGEMYIFWVYLFVYSS